MRKVFQFLVDLVTVDPALKLLALCLAVLVQLAVERESVHESSVTIPVRIRGIAKGQMYIGSLPEAIKIRLRGRRVALAEVAAASGMTLDVDLSSYRDGERYIFTAGAIEQQLGERGIEVVSVQPDSLDVRLEAAQERTLPVEVALTGEVSPGFRVSAQQVQLEPRQVQVIGPASEVRKLSAIRTQPIDLALTDHDLKQMVKLASPDPLIRLAPSEVQATVTLEEQDLARTLVGQPVVIRGCPVGARCTVDPAEVNVRVEGLGRAVRAYVSQPPDNLVVADLAALLDKADRTVRLQVNSVRGLALVPSPAVAKFSVVYDAGVPPGPRPPGPATAALPEALTPTGAASQPR